MEEDRRATPRTPMETFVKDLFQSEPDSAKGMIFRLLTDLSDSGAFVVDRLHSLDPKCTLEIPVPDEPPMAVEAEVVRRTADGAAVRFMSLSETDRARLAKIRGRGQA